MAKKILMVLPPTDFADMEYQTTRRIWEGRGYQVVVASMERGVVYGLEGTPVPVDVALRDVKYYDYDAIVFIGGEGARRLFDDEQARKLAKDAKYKVLGATGNAAVLLSLAGVLEGKRVTAPHEWVGWLIQGRAEYTGRPLEVDDKLITAYDGAAIEHFANAVAKALE
jgi:protease I